MSARERAVPWPAEGPGTPFPPPSPLLSWLVLRLRRDPSLTHPACLPVCILRPCGGSLTEGGLPPSAAPSSSWKTQRAVPRFKGEGPTHCPLRAQGPESLRASGRDE